MKNRYWNGHLGLSRRVQQSMRWFALIVTWGIAVAPAAGSESDTGWSQVPLILSRIQPPTFPDRDFSIRDFGAEDDGTADCTRAFRAAIEACNKAGGGRVVVPPGIFLTGAIHLLSNVNLHLQEGAVIRFSRDPRRYLPVVRTRWEGVECMNYSPFIYALERRNVAITGKGTLDGQANEAHWWPWSRGAHGRPNQAEDRKLLMRLSEEGVPVEKRVFGDGHYLRPQFIQPYRSRNVLIEGVTILNSPMWSLHPVLCENVVVRDVTVVGDGPNMDGCNPESCRDVLIENCFFDTGDDCIALKSGRNEDGRRLATPVENVVIRGCRMKNGHGGVVIGSEMSGGARNVFAEDCVMSSPELERCLRIKTNSRRGGVVEGVYMRNVEVGEVSDAVIRVNYFYEEGDAGEFTPAVRRVRVSGVRASKSRHALYLRGYERSPVTDVVIEDCAFDGVQEGNVIENVQGLTLRRVTMNGRPLDLAVGSSTAAPWSIRMAESEMKRNPDPTFLDSRSQPSWNYAAGLVVRAILELYEKTRDPKHLDYVRAYYDYFITESGGIRGYDSAEHNIDHINAGKTLFFFFRETGETKYRKAVDLLRRQLAEQPRTSEGGFWHKRIYPHQMWLDGLFMGATFLAEYGATFGEPGAVDDAVRQFLLMEKHARDERTGLLYHGWDESRKQRWANPKTGRSPHFWGRAMGWYAMALADVLDFVPKNHAQRAEIIAILKRLASAVVRVQDPATGVWSQVLDRGGQEGNYHEASASCMFTYALLKGARRGYLDRECRDAAERAYQGILKEFVTVDAAGEVGLNRVCAVAGLGGNPYRDGSYEYYVGAPIRPNDAKGVGPFILASLEMERLGR
ncbi:MAG: glycoside hydrolase family 88 protein [Vicinamibacteria bacterium]|nr:glycoside hydrolase family 88 protein [Vicinamibacteria bacterium]